VAYGAPVQGLQPFGIRGGPEAAAEEIAGFQRGGWGEIGRHPRGQTPST